MRRGEPFAGHISPSIGQLSRWSIWSRLWLAAAGLSALKHLWLALCQLSSRTQPVLGNGERCLRRKTWEPVRKDGKRPKYCNKHLPGFLCLLDKCERLKTSILSFRTLQSLLKSLLTLMTAAFWRYHHFLSFGMSILKFSEKDFPFPLYYVKMSVT